MAYIYIWKVYTINIKIMIMDVLQQHSAALLGPHWSGSISGGMTWIKFQCCLSFIYCNILYICSDYFSSCFHDFRSLALSLTFGIWKNDLDCIDLILSIVIMFDWFNDFVAQHYARSRIPLMGFLLLEMYYAFGFYVRNKSINEITFVENKSMLLFVVVCVFCIVGLPFSLCLSFNLCCKCREVCCCFHCVLCSTI